MLFIPWSLPSGRGGGGFGLEIFAAVGTDFGEALKDSIAAGEAGRNAECLLHARIAHDAVRDFAAQIAGPAGHLGNGEAAVAVEAELTGHHGVEQGAAQFRSQMDEADAVLFGGDIVERQEGRFPGFGVGRKVRKAPAVAGPERAASIRAVMLM